MFFMVTDFNKKWMSGNSSPTTGTMGVGDICWNRTPAANGNLGWVCVTAGTANNTPWVASTAYAVGALVNANNKVYRATVAGTSGTTAPSHTSATAVDGTVTWEYVGGLAVFKGFGAIQA